MLLHNPLSRRALLLAGAIASGLACIQLECAPAHAQASGRTDSLAQSLVDSTARHIPKGYSTARASRGALGDDDRRSGAVAAVSVSLGGGDPKGSIRYVLFRSESEAEAAMRGLVERFPRGSALVFLQYLPSANCADTRDGGVCVMRAGDVVIIAAASQVDRGASLVLLAAKDTVQASTASASSNPSSPGTSPQPASAGARGACALLTKADAAAALGSAVSDPRQERETCFYGSTANRGDGVTLQLIDGGRSKFDFDRGRIQRVIDIPGIGEGAFAFVSQAGFVQLYFLKGNDYAALTLQSSQDPNKVDAAKALARKIVGRL